jgi:RNA polymerase sigma-70 factor (ECF subfamily)
VVDDDETAHEIASEAFARLLARWSTPDNPLAYLYKIATNLVRDHWRRTRREREALIASAADQLGPPISNPGAAVDLRQLLEPLPEHQRAAVVLHYLAGFPLNDVAAIVGRPVGTVKSDLSLARERLRHGRMAIDE